HPPRPGQAHWLGLFPYHCLRQWRPALSNRELFHYSSVRLLNSLWNHLKRWIRVVSIDIVDYLSRRVTTRKRGSRECFEAGGNFLTLGITTSNLLKRRCRHSGPPLREYES